MGRKSTEFNMKEYQKKYYKENITTFKKRARGQYIKSKLPSDYKITHQDWDTPIYRKIKSLQVKVWYPELAESR